MSILVGQLKASRVELRIPWRGCWEIRADLQGPAPSPGAAVVDWRGWKITGGRIDPERSGTFQGAARVVIVGGLGWSTVLLPGWYQTDQGLKASQIAADLARQCGERIVVASASDRSVGRSWVRWEATGGASLTKLVGDGWWVSLDGQTNVGPRAVASTGHGVEVLSYDPHDGEVELFANRPDDVPLGSVVVSSRIPGGRRRVVELVATALGDRERVRAHTEAI